MTPVRGRADAPPSDLRPAPGPTSNGYVNLARYARDPLGFLTALAREHGDVARFRLAGRDYFLLNRPDYIQDVLVTHHRSFSKGRFYTELKRLLGDGLLTSEGDVHHRQRRLIQPLFSHERITAYGAVMVDCAARTGERWRAGAELDVSEEMMELTLNVVAKAVLDADVEAEASEVGSAVDASMTAFNRFLLPFSGVLWSVPVPATRRFERSREALDALIYSLIARTRARGGEGADLLSLLVGAQDSDGEDGMSDAQVRDEVMTMLLAGHETTAQALTWTWYLLAEHPEVESRLHDELDRVLGGRPPGADDVPRLPYTQRVLSESMRLFPPAWIVTRRALVEHEVGGYRIPAGAIVFVSPFVTHRDPRFFPAPLRFDPERWGEDTAPGRAKFVYFPFGGGPRLCIGARFAWMEGGLVLATLARRWRLRLAPGHRIELAPLVTLRPKFGMWMRPEAR